MPYARVDEVEIFYDVTGPDDAEPLVLLAGTGAQLIGWRDEFCALLVAEGFRVIRIDNRDVGLSQKFGGRCDRDGGYGLGDMAADVVRVLDAEGIDRAHLAGHSMGGMIAQMVAIEHPARARSLALLATIPGRAPRYILHGDLHDVPLIRLPKRLAVAAAVTASRPNPRSHYVWDTAWAREAAALAYDRCYAPEGVYRQWSALKRAPERLELLRAVRVPTFVMHGRDDESLHWCAAVEIAEAIPDAELMILPGIDHALPREIWPRLVAGIVRAARR